MLHERLNRRIAEQPSASEKLILWDSHRYFSDAEDSTPERASQREDQLRQDLSSFFDEYSFLRAAVVYPYGPTGMRQGYSQSLSEITEHFMQKMHTEGRPIERAHAEVLAAHYIQDWMTQHPFAEFPERIIAMSPRGTEAELYPGLQEKNYVFINIFEKTEQAFVLRQYRSYDTNEQLPLVQQQLAALSPYGNGLQKIAPVEFPTQDHQTITTFVHLPQDVPLTQIEDILYERKKKWAIDIDRELPQLPSPLRVSELERTTQYCLSQFRELQQQKMLSASEKQLQFTELVLLVRKALLKWAEDHATNYHPEQEENLLYHLDFVLITETWKANLKKKAGAKLKEEEVNILEQFSQLTKLDPVLPLKGAASWAHCITGTPQSILLKAGMHAGRVASGGSLLGYRGMLGQLDLRERTQLAESLRHYIRIRVGDETWYVPDTYRADPGCSVDTQTGLVVGPCGIPLIEDPLAYSAEEYEQLQAALADSPEEILQSLSGEEQARIRTITSWLVAELFVSTASIDRILIGDILKAEQHIHSELLPLRAFLFRSSNPLSQVLWYVLTLSEQDEQEGIEKLEQVMDHYTSEKPVAGQEILLFSASQLL